MGKRNIPEINAGSMADIAFLLLIFFLVTTTMDVDSGLARKLPPPVPKDQEPPPPIKERNVLMVLINKKNQLAVEAEPFDISRLKEKTKEFITNPKNDKNLSDGKTLQQKYEAALNANNAKDVAKYKRLIKLFGATTRVSKGVVSLQNDRSTSYKIYIEVQNELVAAYNELRNDLSKRAFAGKKYDELSTQQQKDIREIYPLSISEAEPRNIGG